MTDKGNSNVAHLRAVQTQDKGKLDPKLLLDELDAVRARVENGEVTGLFWFEMTKGCGFDSKMTFAVIEPVSDLEIDGILHRIAGTASNASVEDEQ